MMIEQGSKCRICGIYADKLSVDHNHKTGQIRGLLCNKCNTGLGMFQDNTSIIESALKYLSSPNQSPGEFTGNTGHY